MDKLRKQIFETEHMDVPIIGANIDLRTDNDIQTAIDSLALSLWERGVGVKKLVVWNEKREAIIISVPRGRR